MIQLKSERHNAILKLKDSGAGIVDKDQLHIFDRFYRGTTKRKVQGNGLGLAIAQSIVHVHHGNIKAKSKLNQGTEIIISLPLSD